MFSASVRVCMYGNILIIYYRFLDPSFTFSKRNVYLGTLGLAVQFHATEILSLQKVALFFRLLVSSAWGINSSGLHPFPVFQSFTAGSYVYILLWG